MLRVFLSMVLFCSSCLAISRGLKGNRFEGFIYRKGKTYYISKAPGTTYPRYALQWQNYETPKEICFYPTSERCPRYTIAFEAPVQKNGRLVLSQARLVRPKEEVDARLRFISQILTK